MVCGSTRPCKVEPDALRPHTGRIRAHERERPTWSGVMWAGGPFRRKYLEHVAKKRMPVLRTKTCVTNNLEHAFCVRQNAFCSSLVNEGMSLGDIRQNLPLCRPAVRCLERSDQLGFEPRCSSVDQRRERLGPRSKNWLACKIMGKRNSKRLARRWTYFMQPIKAGPCST
jgi:hypothetical protein